METVEFNKHTAMQFGRAYNKAVREGQEMFVFKEKPMLTKYGFFLVQHLINVGLIKGELNKSIIKFY